MGFIFSMCLWIDDDDGGENIQKTKKTAKKFLISLSTIVFLSTMTYIFTPTTKQYIAMKIIPSIVNNQKIQNISDKTLQLVEKILDVKLSEIEKEIQPTPEKK